MNKFTTILASLTALAAFTSCEDDKVTFQTPAAGSYKMEAPSFASSLTMTEETAKSTLDFVTNVPDYGYQAAAVYSLQVALDESFATYESITGSDAYSSTIEITQEDLSYALCNLHGFGPDYFEELAPETVYVRGHVEVTNAAGSAMTTNVVALSNVTFYHVIHGKRSIYVIGNISGWTEPSEGNAAALADWTLTETAIGSNIYYNSFDLAAGEVMFRFYTALTGWDGGNSLGAQEEDNAINIDADFDGLIYNGNYTYPGKGSWQISNFGGGLLKLTVNMNDETVTFELGAAGEVDYSKYDCMYIIGSCSGWVEPSEGNAEALANWKVYDLKEDGVYVTPKPVYMPNAQFRFYKALTGWDGGDSLGYQEEDAGTDFDLTDGVFTSPYVYPGKGNWVFPNDGDNWWLLEVDTNTQTVTFQITEAPEGGDVPPTPIVDETLYVMGGMNDWTATEGYNFSNPSEDVWYLGNVEIPAGVEFKFANSDWSVYDFGGDGTAPVIGVEYTLAKGGANISLEEDFVGNITITYDGENYVVLFKEAAPGDPSGIYLRGGMNGWGADAAWEFVTTDQDNVWVLNNVTIEEGTEFKVADADWTAVNYGLEEALVFGQEMVMSAGGTNIVMPQTATVNITITQGEESFTILVEAQ